MKREASQRADERARGQAPPQTRDRSSQRARHHTSLRSATVATLASLLAHGSLISALLVMIPSPPSPPSQLREEAVPLLSKEEAERLLKRYKQRTKRPEPPKPPPPPPPKREPDPKGQVVDIPPPPQEKIPTKARFLSEFNSAVERERVNAQKQPPQPKVIQSERQVLAGGDDLKGKKKGKLGVKSSAKRQSPSPNQQKRASKAQPRRSAQPKRSTTQAKRRAKARTSERKATQPSAKKRLLIEGEGPFKRSPEEQRSSSAPRPSPHMGSAGQLAPTDYQSLLPTLGPQASQRQDGSIDHVPDVTQGADTALNTKEFRFAHFFNRVKREVASRWRAVEVYRAYDPRGNVYGVKDRHTVVVVTLYPNGALAEIEVAQSCGVRALDLEAMEAFQRAQPFHNPPKGLMDEDGLIRFKFGFFLEIGGGGFRFLP